MLETYFSAQKTLARLRTGPSGPYIDGFADALEQEGYSPASAVRYLRAAAHFGHFLHRRRCPLADVDAGAVKAFRSHLRRCHCPLSNGGTVNHHVVFGAKRFYLHLCQTGVCHAEPVLSTPNAEPALLASFREWFQRHRWATAPPSSITVGVPLTYSPDWATISVNGTRGASGHSCSIEPS